MTKHLWGNFVMRHKFPYIDAPILFIQTHSLISVPWYKKCSLEFITKPVPEARQDKCLQFQKIIINSSQIYNLPCNDTLNLHPITIHLTNTTDMFQNDSNRQVAVSGKKQRFKRVRMILYIEMDVTITNF